VYRGVRGCALFRTFNNGGPGSSPPPAGVGGYWRSGVAAVRLPKRSATGAQDRGADSKFQKEVIGGHLWSSRVTSGPSACGDANFTGSSVGRVCVVDEEQVMFASFSKRLNSVKKRSSSRVLVQAGLVDELERGSVTRSSHGESDGVEGSDGVLRSGVLRLAEPWSVPRWFMAPMRGAIPPEALQETGLGSGPKTVWFWSVSSSGDRRLQPASELFLLSDTDSPDRFTPRSDRHD
jgi:hypothetical protein